MRFECYRNKAIAVEAPVVHTELAESTINSEPVISEPKIEIETTSDITEEVSNPSCSELNEDVTELPKEEATPSKGRSHTFYHQQYSYRRIRPAIRI